MFKVDLHTHSVSSYDGGITLEQYRHALDKELLDVIAITDHNDIEFALEAQKVLGQERIIVGEEIMSAVGEIVGLYLTKRIPPRLSASETIDAIREQGGLVLIPHPFETVRKGLHPEVLDSVKNDVDIIEVCNGRALIQNRGSKAYVWSHLNHIPGSANSDAHGVRGLGTTYNSIPTLPNRKTLVDDLQQAHLITSRPPLSSLLYPKYHRVLKKIKKS